MEKVENAGQQHFLLFRQCFQKAFSLVSLQLENIWLKFNSLPNNKILDLSKLEAFADDKLKVAKIMKCLFDREENIVEIGEKMLLPAFSPFLKLFLKNLLQGRLKSGFYGKELTLSQTSPGF